MYSEPMLLLLLACHDPAGPALRMDFTGDLYDAPFPSEGRDLAGFPNPDGVPLVEQLLALLEKPEGFGRTSAVFFTAERPLDPASLPSLADSVGADSPVYLIDIDPASPQQGQRLPLLVGTLPDGGPFGADNLLSLLPLQGVPLRSGTRYAAVVTRAVRTAGGVELGQSPALTALIDGELAPGMDPSYAEALDALIALGQDPDSIAAFSAFTTGRPEEQLAVLRAAAPEIRSPTGLGLTEVYDSFCVYEGQVEVPVYQQGEPPYLTEGGGISFEGGVPVLDRWEASRLVITLPRQAATRFPTAVFIRTGGGGDRPLVDRGVEAVHGGGALVPGTGPALWMAAAGFAGVSIDGPHGGLRNPTGGDEQFLMFNISNPTALRDNVRQSALEIALLPELLDGLVIDASDCPGLGSSVSLGGPFALTGHSMGATIAPLTLAVGPEYEAVVLSGAGGSWINNVIYKRSPLEVRPLAEAMLGYDAGELTVFDPVLSLLQWAGENADPPVYAQMEGATPRDILMVQGIVDTYILPPIANATSLSFGLDLVGESLDAASEELSEMTPLEAVLPLVGGAALPYPAGGNRGGYTRVVTQHPEDGLEDGHEVLFQTDAPKCQAQALLLALAYGEQASIEACR